MHIELDTLSFRVLASIHNGIAPACHWITVTIFCRIRAPVNSRHKEKNETSRQADREKINTRRRHTTADRNVSMMVLFVYMLWCMDMYLFACKRTRRTANHAKSPQFRKCLPQIPAHAQTNTPRVELCMLQC